MTTSLVPVGTPFTETLRQLAFNHAFDSVRQKQFVRYVEYTGYRTGLKFNLRPLQLADFKTNLAEMTLSTASQKWNPCGGSNVVTFCQSVGELKRRELVRKLMRDHKLEVAADNLGRLLLESGEKVRLVRDWDNDPEEEKASVLENLPSGGIGRHQFRNKFAAMDCEEIVKHLWPEEREIFKALVRTCGNVEAARRYLNDEVYRTERYHRTKFAERTVPALRRRLQKIYFFRRGKDLVMSQSWGWQNPRYRTRSVLAAWRTPSDRFAAASPGDTANVTAVTTPRSETLRVRYSPTLSIYSSPTLRQYRDFAEKSPINVKERN